MQDDENAEHMDEEVKERKDSDFENLEIIKTTLRSLSVPSSGNASSVYHCLPPIRGLELKPSKQEVICIGDEGSLFEGAVLNENNPLLLL